ncbi:hypothetical protein [Streptomyces qinzhouensis]|uniref:Uncharacterized protein n=1 Tax=Streptomyces qinzhouensis TaxID=2599401 RepID=A0A5B8IK11_9ACTN|nr:hypothetical protein [Streptomyces qinzhouensis]QDY78772.1 hypothetical protein FQU76_22195 [Streptomyces qinzhouensis]
MSFWMRLAKISPGLLPEIRKQPGLVPDLFSDDGEAEPLAGVDRDADLLEFQFFPEEENLDHGHWLSTVHRVGEALGEDFDHGDLFAVGPDEVAGIAGALPGGSPVGEFFADAAREGRAVVGGLG